MGSTRKPKKKQYKKMRITSELENHKTTSEVSKNKVIPGTHPKRAINVYSS